MAHQGISPQEGLTHGQAEAGYADPVVGLHDQSDPFVGPDGLSSIAPAYPDPPPPYVGAAMLRNIVYLPVPIVGETPAERAAPGALGEMMHGARLFQEAFWSMLLGGDISLAEPELQPFLIDAAGNIQRARLPSAANVLPASGLNNWGTGETISIGH